MPKNTQSFSYDSWAALEHDVISKSKLKPKGSILVGRGPDHPDTFQVTKSILDSHSFGGYHRSVTLMENNQEFVEPL